MLDTIEMMHAEVDRKVKDIFSEVVYLDDIEHLLGTPDWAHLKTLPIVIVPHKSRKYRAILILSFSLKVFGIEIPSVNENNTFKAPQQNPLVWQCVALVNIVSGSGCGSGREDAILQIGHKGWILEDDCRKG